MLSFTKTAGHFRIGLMNQQFLLFFTTGTRILDKGLAFLLEEYVKKQNYWGDLLISTTETTTYTDASSIRSSLATPIIIQSPIEMTVPVSSKNISLVNIFVCIIFTIFM